MRLSYHIKRILLLLLLLLLLLFSAQGISDTEGEEKWLEHVNAGMTISPDGLLPQNRLKIIIIIIIIISWWNLLSSEELHAKQSENEDEEEQKKEKWNNWTHAVE